MIVGKNKVLIISSKLVAGKIQNIVLVAPTDSCITACFLGKFDATADSEVFDTLFGSNIVITTVESIKFLTGLMA